MAKKTKRIGILTAGGDCPGLNAVIRAVAKTAMHDHGYEAIGFQDGYYGLTVDKWVRLGRDDVSGILTRGGTILGSSNSHDPFRWACEKGGKIVYRDFSGKALAAYRRHGLDALVIVGGDGTMTVAGKLMNLGMNIVGVPKTIDNDLEGTDRTFGFDTAVTTATEAIDKLHDTASSHHRAMIVEVMGRYAGWLALTSGVAGGGDVILIPEIPYRIESVCECLKGRSKRGKRFSIVVVAEGAKALGGEMVVAKHDAKVPDPVRLGGIGNHLAAEIEKRTRLSTRVTVLGHLQRGGTPTAFDRALCTRFGCKAMHLVAEGAYGQIAALRGDEVISVPIKEIAGRVRTVPLDHGLLAAARSVGTCLGD
ncbi:MAG TPA: ATP-dependent 6-phosphofructokinase [Planctomycetota bacterium]|nr:ATP-dependent 6-phosphofructokinase [Planctomycetota bacterium]